MSGATGVDHGHARDVPQTLQEARANNARRRVRAPTLADASGSAPLCSCATAAVSGMHAATSLRSARRRPVAQLTIAPYGTRARWDTPAC